MPRPFTVVAIIAAHNEADVIEHVVRDLIDQGVSVYFIDDDSTDRTREIVERFVGRGVLAIERFDSTPGVFEWRRILQRKAELASTLDADWFIHHDADEFRESPWPGVSLRDAIAHVDQQGFNAIDFTLLDFWPVDDTFTEGTDVREAHRFYAPAEAFNRVQIRCWKQPNEPVDLAESGGHEARFPGRAVCPIPFLLRHYPVRSTAQGRRKIGPERRARYLPDERERGWHVQYAASDLDGSLIRSAESLTRFEPRFSSSLAVALADTRCQLQHALARADAQSQELVRVVNEAHALRAAVDGLQEALHQHRREIASLTDARRNAESRVRELQQSLSWRWTAPARAAYRLITGREA